MNNNSPLFPLTALPFLGKHFEILKMLRTSPVPQTTRPSLTVGRRQMSQRSRANRRKARRKA